MKQWACEQLAPLIGSRYGDVMTPRVFLLAMLAGGDYRASVWAWARQHYLALPGERYAWPIYLDSTAWVLGGRPGALRVATLSGIEIAYLRHDSAYGYDDEQLRAHAELYGRRDVMRARRSP